MIEPVCVMSDAPARAMPKSVTFARPSASTITLCGLRSRWMTPRRWAKRAARRICDRQVDRARRVQRRLVLDDLLQRAAVEELHRDVVGAVPLAAVVDADDVLVLEAGGAGGLAAEALDELLVLGEAAVEHLQRDLAPELEVLGAVDVGHPAGAEALDDPVAAVDDGLGGEAALSLQQRLHDGLGDRRGDRAAEARRRTRR